MISLYNVPCQVSPSAPLLWLPNPNPNPTKRYCSSAMTLLRVSNGGVKIVPTSCHEWTCDHCRPKLTAWLSQQIGTAATEHSLDQFWTLTTRGSENPIASYSKVTDAWRTVSRALQRKYGSFPYLWVKSPQRSGSCHVHLVTSLEVDTEYLRSRWHANTGSYQIKTEAVKSVEAASRYLANNAAAFGALKQQPDWAGLKGLNIFKTSKGIHFTPYGQSEPSENEYLRVNMPFTKATARLDDLGIPLDQDMPAKADDILSLLGAIQPNKMQLVA